MFDKIAKTQTFVFRILWVCGFALALGIAWKWTQAIVIKDVYEKKLHSTQQRYNTLTEAYNRAITLTTVCLVRVKDDQIHLVYRDATGREISQQVNFSPSNEVYFDAVLYQGRILLRRIYDSQTAPCDGTLVSSALMGVDPTLWKNAEGLSVYRPGGLSEGTWAIKASGNGALRLQKAEDEQSLPLQPLPKVTSFETQEKMEPVTSPSFFDVIHHLAD